MSVFEPAIDICMIVDNDVVHDARVRKEAASLAAHGRRIVVVGVSRSGPEPQATEEVAGFTIVRAIPRLSRKTVSGKAGNLIRTVTGYMIAARMLRRANARVYHAHDFTGLVIVALAGIWRRPVVYDSHELYFDRPQGWLTQHLEFVLRWLERVLARRAVRMIATTESHGQQLSETLGVPQPVIVRNAVDLRVDQSESVPVTFETPYTLAHSGWLIRGRHLNELIGALQYLPDDISVVLIGDGPVRGELESRADALGVSNRLVMTGEILPHQMIGTLKQATLAAVLMTFAYPNYHLGLPNKFFEAVAAGLPMIASPIPEAKRLIERYDIGVICDPGDPKSIAEAVRVALEPDNLARMRENARRAQRDLSWEAEEVKLVALYEDVFQGLK